MLALHFYWMDVHTPYTIYDFPIILGISSSQLTKSIIFQRGRVGIPPTRYIIIYNHFFITINGKSPPDNVLTMTAMTHRLFSTTRLPWPVPFQRGTEPFWQSIGTGRKSKWTNMEISFLCKHGGRFLQCKHRVFFIVLNNNQKNLLAFHQRWVFFLIESNFYSRRISMETPCVFSPRRVSRVVVPVAGGPGVHGHGRLAGLNPKVGGARRCFFVAVVEDP